jgi:hypothetical protein
MQVRGDMHSSWCTTGVVDNPVAKGKNPKILQLEKF